MQVRPSTVHPATRTCRQSCHHAYATLAEHEESVEAFSLFSLIFFFFFIVVILARAQLCLALWHGWKCPHICTVIVIFSIDMRCFTNSAPPWRRCFSLQRSHRQDQACSFTTRRGGFPACLTFPPSAAVTQNSSIAIYLHASSAVLHVLRNRGNSRRGRTGGYVSVKTG